jgi:hypothetical protein
LTAMGACFSNQSNIENSTAMGRRLQNRRGGLP